MSPLGITQPVIIPTILPQSSGPLIPTAPVVVLPSGGAPTQTGYDPLAAEQALASTVQHVAQHIANAYVLGDQTFTIFKDATGQYITRFTNITTGQVTYVPQPSLFQLGESAIPDTTGLLDVNT